MKYYSQYLGWLQHEKSAVDYKLAKPCKEQLEKKL